MGFRSFKESESEQIVTVPNAMSAARAVGGVAFGALLWSHGLAPIPATVAAGVLGASDAEGNVIDFFSKHPRLHRIQDTLRIVPSKIGRKTDPVADKIFMVAALAGGAAGHLLPMADVMPIVATEMTVSGVSVWGEAHGRDPQVSKIGKIGMAVRALVLGNDLLAAGVHGTAHEVMRDIGHGGAAAAVALGAVSCYNLWQQSRQPSEEAVS